MPRQKPVVAIVDDEAIIRKSLEIILRKSGYEVIAARNAEKLLEQLPHKLAQVYIIDYDLPGLNGIELAHQIIARQRSAKIIILSGLSIDNESEHTHPANFVSFLIKPVDIELMVKLIDKSFTLLDDEASDPTPD